MQDRAHTVARARSLKNYKGDGSPSPRPPPPGGIARAGTLQGGVGWHKASGLGCLTFGGAYWPLTTACSDPLGPNVFWLCQRGGNEQLKSRALVLLVTIMLKRTDSEHWDKGRKLCISVLGASAGPTWTLD